MSKQPSAHHKTIFNIVLPILIAVALSFCLYRIGFYSEPNINLLALCIEIMLFLGGLLIFKGQWKPRLISFGLVFALFTLIWGYVPVPSSNFSKTSSAAELPSIEAPEETPAPTESSPPDITPAPFETTEKQSFATVEKIENDLQSKSFYTPQLDNKISAYLFVNNQIIAEHHDETHPLSDDELLELIRERFYTAYHCVENYPVASVNGDPYLSSLILSAEDIDLAIRQAVSTNQIADLPAYYDKLMEIYEIATTSAPRGEYFLQLGRPYYEKALYMKRETNREKNEAFRLCAEAINSYRMAATYTGYCGESDADLLYRIAAAYHYLGDTPSLSPSYRTELYRYAFAYLSLAESLSSPEDDYYGYITYYKGMVLHKLAIVSSDSINQRRYFLLAKNAYTSVSELREFNISSMSELDHALKNVEYRLSFFS